MNSQCLVVIQTHNLIVVTLCASLCVVCSTIPQTDGTFYVVRRVVVTHNEYEHLSALLYTETVVECVTLAAATLLEYDVAVLHKYWSNLHGAAALAAYRTTVSFTLHLDDGIHEWAPVKFTPVVTSISLEKEAVDNECK